MKGRKFKHADKVKTLPSEGNNEMRIWFSEKYQAYTPAPFLDELNSVEQFRFSATKASQHEGSQVSFHPL